MVRTFLVLMGAAAAAAVLSGCSPMSRMPTVDQNLAAVERDKQTELMMREQHKRTMRVNNIGWQVLQKNAADCGESVAPGFGMRVFDETQTPEQYRAVWRRMFGAHGRPVVTAVAAGSPAQAQDLRPGDVILEINGVATDTEEGRGKLKEPWIPPGELMARFLVRRDAVERPVFLHAESVCSYPVELMAGDVVNAYADGQKIFITQGMLRFATSDDELALVIGHELGHNTQGHINAQLGNRLIGGLLGALVSVAIRVDVSQVGVQAGQLAFSKEFEAEADYVGTYYAAKAGFKVDEAANFWRRMAVEHPAAIGHGTTHPDTASRFVAIEAAVKEVTEKRAAGAALVPEKKQ